MKNLETSKSYVIGFVFSLLLTFAAYFTVVNQLLSGSLLLIVVIALAVTQLFVQLFFFLHVWQESKPRWNLAIFLSTLSIILLIIIGSLWIMNNLNYNHIKSPSETDNYIIKNEGINR